MINLALTINLKLHSWVCITVFVSIPPGCESKGLHTEQPKIMIVSKSGGICDVTNVTYDHRVDDIDAYNFCVVPGRGEDAFLFAAVAVFTACFLHFSSLSAVLVLVAGAIAEIFVYCMNLGHLGNSFSIWLGVDPQSCCCMAFCHRCC